MENQERYYTIQFEPLNSGYGMRFEKALQANPQLSGKLVKRRGYWESSEVFEVAEGLNDVAASREFVREVQRIDKGVNEYMIEIVNHDLTEQQIKVGMAKASGGTRGGGYKYAAPSSERDFFRVTGYRYGHDVDTYRQSLALLNTMPDSAKIFTGATVGQAKEYLKRQIRKIGGSTRVGKVSDWIIDEV